MTFCCLGLELCETLSVRETVIFSKLLFSSLYTTPLITCNRNQYLALYISIYNKFKIIPLLKSIDNALKVNNFIYLKNNFTELVLFAHNLKHILVLKLSFTTNAPFFLIEMETCVKQQHQRHSGAVRVTMKSVYKCNESLHACYWFHKDTFPKVSWLSRLYEPDNVENLRYAASDILCFQFWKQKCRCLLNYFKLSAKFFYYFTQI